MRVLRFGNLYRIKGSDELALALPFNGVMALVRWRGGVLFVSPSTGARCPVLAQPPIGRLCMHWGVRCADLDALLEVHLYAPSRDVRKVRSNDKRKA